MAQILLKKHCSAAIPVPPIPSTLKDALLAHSWPGNIRELENVMRRLIVLRNPDVIAAELRAKAARRFAVSPAVPESSGLRAPNEPILERVLRAPNEPILERVTKAKHQAETDAILAALSTTRWNRKKAAALLGIDYKALLYKMKKLAIEDKCVSFPAYKTVETGGGEAALSQASGR